MAQVSGYMYMMMTWEDDKLDVYMQNYYMSNLSQNLNKLANFEHNKENTKRHRYTYMTCTISNIVQ